MTRERRRFSAAMMRSVEVGIQRRIDGHRDLVLAHDDDVDEVDVAVVAAADDPSSSAIFKIELVTRRRSKFM